MYNEELLKSVESQEEGVVVLKRDYKLFLEEGKKELAAENRNYEYSAVNSVVRLDKENVKIIYANYPSNSEDFYNRYTNLRNIVIKISDIKNLKFVD